MHRPPCRPENEVEISLAIRPGGNVVLVYGFCFDAPDGKVRIVLELCAHGSVRSHLRSLPRDKVHRGWPIECSIRVYWAVADVPCVCAAIVGGLDGAVLVAVAVDVYHFVADSEPNR